MLSSLGRSCLVLLLVAVLSVQAIDYEAERHDAIPRSVAKLTTRSLLETISGAKQRKASYTLQEGTELFLQYGALLRVQILDSFGKLLYEHYDDFSIEEVESLYRVYRETLERKYNVFELAPVVLSSADSRPSRICSYIHDYVRTCLKESAQVCRNIRKHDYPHPRALVSGESILHVYRAGRIARLYPKGFSLPIVLKYLQKGRLRLTPALLAGLLHNVRYDVFDDEVRSSERELILHLGGPDLADSSQGHLPDAPTLREMKSVHTIGSLLKLYLRSRKARMPARIRRDAEFLAEHIVGDVDSVSENIQLLGNVYENGTIRVDYLLELVVPFDLVDPDVVEARDYLVDKLRLTKVVERNLRVDRYLQASPDQLTMEIVGQLREIGFAADIATAIRAHARFWHRSHMIENLNDLLELFDAYENLRHVAKYRPMMRAIDRIKQNLWDSRNVSVELLCNSPRACLRLGLQTVMRCTHVNRDTKDQIAEFFKAVTPKGSLVDDECPLPMDQVTQRRKVQTTTVPSTEGTTEPSTEMTESTSTTTVTALHRKPVPPTIPPTTTQSETPSTEMEITNAPSTTPTPFDNGHDTTSARPTTKLVTRMSTTTPEDSSTEEMNPIGDRGTSTTETEGTTTTSGPSTRAGSKSCGAEGCTEEEDSDETLSSAVQPTTTPVTTTSSVTTEVPQTTLPQDTSGSREEEDCEEEDCEEARCSGESCEKTCDEGEDCSTTPCSGESCESSCEGEECSSSDCSGGDCPETSSEDCQDDDEECQASEAEAKCESGDEASCTTSDQCSGEDCSVVLDEEDSCADGRCRPGIGDKSNTCRGEGCEQEAELTPCRGDNCPSKSHDETSCEGSDCTPEPDISIELSDKANRSSVYCDNKDPNHQRKLSRLQKMMKISAIRAAELLDAQNSSQEGSGEDTQEVQDTFVPRRPKDFKGSEYTQETQGTFVPWSPKDHKGSEYTQETQGTFVPWSPKDHKGRERNQEIRQTFVPRRPKDYEGGKYTQEVQSTFAPRHHESYEKELQVSSSVKRPRGKLTKVVESAQLMSTEREKPRKRARHESETKSLLEQLRPMIHSPLRHKVRVGHSSEGYSMSMKLRSPKLRKPLTSGMMHLKHLAGSAKIAHLRAAKVKVVPLLEAKKKSMRYASKVLSQKLVPGALRATAKRVKAGRMMSHGTRSLEEASGARNAQNANVNNNAHLAGKKRAQPRGKHSPVKMEEHHRNTMAIYQSQTEKPASLRSSRSILRRPLRRELRIPY